MSTRPHRARRVVRAAALASVFAVAVPATACGADPTLVSAFFGLDNSTNLGLSLLCGGARSDGMPIVTSAPVVGTTLQASDFSVTLRSGAARQPRCATLRPATERGENRTILLIGDLGDDPADPPLSVTVTGSVKTGAGDLQGQSVSVTELAAGPTMVAAERIAGSTGAGGRSPGCPVRATRQTARVIWDGGITRAAGKRTRPSDARVYAVTYSDATKETPFGLGDLNDQDNYHELCLKQRKAIRSITVRSGYWVDPNGDLNVARLSLSRNITG